MRRERIGLDGDWSFWPDVHGALPRDPGDARFVPAPERTSAAGAPRSARVPGPWQAHFDDLRLWSGAAWYERSFRLPASWSERAVRLCFGAVDYHTTVWVNGRPAGVHEGGYLPFSLDIAEHVAAGQDNTVTLRVLDPGPRAHDGEPDFAEVPHGKQSWYGPLGGIWQSVYLEASAPLFVERALVRADPLSGRTAIRAELGAPGSGTELVHYRVAAPGEHDTFTSPAYPLEPGSRRHEASVDVGPPELWDVDAPRLYRLEVAVHDRDGRELDLWTDSFGFRSIEARAGDILLNGRSLYILGALDQDYYLDTICTPPSDDLLRRQLLRAKELGLNLLRCHIKVPDPRYLAWADRLGVLVWSELPNWGVLTEASARRARATLEGMIERDFNHPSIVIWTIVNESWGVDLAGNPEHRRWLEDTFEWVKGLDPTRLVVDNSACAPNFHVRTDLNDFHIYRALPEDHEGWRAWTRAWVADPASTFSPHGDAFRTGEEPLVLSEFGNWGLPDVTHLLDAEGGEPWWFDTGGDRIDVDFLVEGIQEQLAQGIVRPRGVRERFEEWGLEHVFGSWSDFVRASQEHQFEAIGFEIADLRRHAAVRGYVITELTDCHWECNGLLDMARRPKAYHDRFRELNGPDVVVPGPSQRRFVTGDEAEVPVAVSHFSDSRLEPCSVAWTVPELGLRGRPLHGSAGRGQVHELGAIRFTVPALHEPVRVSLWLSLRDAAGAEVNRAQLPLLLFPRAEAPTGNRVRVAARWDADIAAHLRSGGRAVIVASDPGAVPPGRALRLRQRAGTPWEGDWAQGMTWLRPALTEGLPLLPWVDMAWIGLTPRLVIHGLTPAERDDVLAALYVGWVHATVATIACFGHGSGAGILCTFPLLDTDDPLARAVLQRLIDLAAAPDLAPGKHL